MTSQPDVLFASPLWKQLSTVAVFGILVYVVGFLTVTSYMAVKMPKCFHNVVFRRRWKFLFKKFKPEVWWWGNVVIFRGILLNVVVVAFEDPSSQIWTYLVLIGVYLSFLVVTQPWRHIVGVIVDVLSSASLLSATGLAAMFLPREDIDSSSNAVGLIFITGLPVVPLLVMLISFPPQFLATEMKLGERVHFGYKFRGLLQAVLQFSSPDLQRLFVTLAEHDMNLLLGTYSVLMTELFGTQPSRNFVPRRFMMKAQTVRPVCLKPSSVGGSETNMLAWHAYGAPTQHEKAALQAMHLLREKVLNRPQGWCDKGSPWLELIQKRVIARQEFVKAAGKDLGLNEHVAEELFNFVALTTKDVTSLPQMRVAALGLNDYLDGCFSQRSTDALNEVTRSGFCLNPAYGHRGPLFVSPALLDAPSTVDQGYTVDI